MEMQRQPAIQEKVIEVSNLYLVNHPEGTTSDLEKFDTSNLENIYEISSEYFPEQPVQETKKVYLASIAKLPIAKLFVETFKDSEYVRISATNFRRILGDLYKREQIKVVFEKEKDYYHDIIRQLLILPADTDLNNEVNFNSSLEKLSRMKFTGDDSVDFPVDELVRLVLWSSANEPLTTMKDLIIGETKEDTDEIRQEKRQAYVKRLKAFAPDFSPTLTTLGFAHWLQEDANTGYLWQIAKILHEEVVASQENESGFTGIIQTVENNELKFDFDFTNSAFGKELIGKGYKIYEKTGYWPSVNWVSDLAKQGFPTHMAMSNVVTIVAPNGQIKTFYQSMNFKMPFPSKTENMGGVSFPDVDSKEYEAITLKAKASANIRFREEISVIIRRAFGI